MRRRDQYNRQDWVNEIRKNEGDRRAISDALAEKRRNTRYLEVDQNVNVSGTVDHNVSGTINHYNY